MQDYMHTPGQESDNSSASSPDPNTKSGKKIMKCRWIGQPIKKGTEKEHYYAVKLQQHIYHVGDCARFKASSGSKPFVGRISALYEGSSKF